MPGGDILDVQQRSERPFFVDVVLASAGGTALTRTAKSTKHAIRVQKIVLSITTHAAKDFTVSGSSGSPGTIANHTDAAAGAGIPSVVTWDFGPHGVKLADGASLVVATTATASLVGIAHIEGYEPLSATQYADAGGSGQ